MKKRIIAILAAVSMAVSLLPTVSFAAETKPVLHYTFDGSKELASEDGKNELKLNGGATVTDEGNVGKGLLLDGVDGYALLPENILTDKMTISAWVKINRFATWARVFDFGTDDTNNFFLSPYSGGTTRIEMKTPSDVNSIDAPQETEREWVHYAVTYDSGTINYYRNGRLMYTKANLSIKPSDIKNELNYIGKSHYDADAYLSAVIDDFCVYDKALTRQEILNEMSYGNLDDDVILNSYAIEDGLLITGDRIDLPGFVMDRQVEGPIPGSHVDRAALEWDCDDEELVKSIEQTESGWTIIFNQPEKTTEITLGENIRKGDASHGNGYTAYLVGKSESPYTINIDAGDRSKDVSDEMWGLFFEDINSAADGGLYAEMVQNRSFETEKDGHLYSWETEGDVKINTENPMNENNPTYITMASGASITNDGFQGMSIKAGEKYNFSIYVRPQSFDGLSIRLIGDDGEVIPFVENFLSDGTIIDGFDIGGGGATDSRNPDEIQRFHDEINSWGKIDGDQFVIEPTKDAANAKLIITNNSGQTLDVDMISLIPEDTYKGHGLRKDFMEALEAMHPQFLRFPGGCAIEGNTMETAWNWKDTVGDVAERKEMVNIWSPSDNTYMMTYGLGFYEYFQMCEDLDMEPVPILNCGMACQARSGGKTDENYLVPMDELQPYIDDALDLIEFANGTDESNEWVKLRIDMGHPEPFGLKYIGIGNEQFGDIYFERYEAFAKQIHEKYPEMNLVTTSGTASSGTNNDLAWNWINDHTELADRVDEHYYENPDWFRTHAYRYDNYRRDTNSKVFLGEYASKGNAWYNALSEAAFMTGLERNADVVRMASYAPMFAKYGNTQWSAANMIWFNNDDMMLTPNYYVQSLFSNNKGDYSLPTDVKMNGIDTDDTFKGGVVLGSWGTQNEFKDIVVENQNNENIYLSPHDDGDEKSRSDGTFWGWWHTDIGEWSIKDGVISQTSDSTGATAWWRYLYGEDNNNYTVNVKARKLSGGEGFQIGVAAEDNLNYYRVNIGGWGNTTAKIQHIVNGVSSEVGNVAEQSYVGEVHIEDDRWYDVRVEVTDYEIKAYLDGEFICSYTKPLSYGPIYASSVYDEENGEVIVKVVNTLGSEVPVDLNITGANITGSLGKTFVMAGDTSLENSLDNPTAIVPYASEITNAANYFKYTAPANSLTVMRLSAETSGANHTAYISGYTDYTFRPDNSITRAEAATLFANIDGIDFSKEYASSGFTDVQAGWFIPYVNYCNEKGYISGYDDGTFKPNNSITRAEFTVIAAKYLDLKPEEKAVNSLFSDVKSDFWAKEYINAMTIFEKINGYEDGTFKPDNPITRAEAVTMINNILRRWAINADQFENPFTDVSPTHWAYNEILEAAVSH